MNIVAAPRASLLVAAFAAASACAAFRPNAPADARRTTAALALAPYFRELRVVHVMAGDDPLTMLVDTGGGATLITPAVAARHGCQPYGRDVGYRMTGERVEFQRCDAIALSAGGWRRRVEPVAVFDVNALLPKELPALDGVLALDAFRGDTVTLDWPAAAITVHGSEGAAAALERHGIEARFATGETGRMLSAFVPVAAHRGRLWFLLDSGNLRGTLVGSHVVADRLLDDPAPTGRLTLAIASRPPAAMPAEVTNLAIDGALGTSFLMQGPVTLDLRGGASLGRGRDRDEGGQPHRVH